MADTLRRLAAEFDRVAQERLRVLADGRLDDVFAADAKLGDLIRQWDDALAHGLPPQAAERVAIAASLEQAQAALAAAQQIARQYHEAIGHELAQLPRARKGLTAYLHASRE